jgi:hypothetical protein
MKIKLLLILLFATLSACHDIVETDISGQGLHLTAPADSIETKGQDVFFSWEGLPGATRYRLQIAEPDFSNLQTMFLDTTIGDTKLIFSIPEGLYEWRVRGENSSYMSPYSSRRIFVDISPPLASVPVLPVYDATVASPAVLAWRRNQATKKDSIYIYQDSSLNAVLYTQLAQDTFINFQGSPGKYYWFLKSIDALGNTSPKGFVSRFSIK